MRRVLIIGAAGFIGRRLVARLFDSGWAQPIAAVHRVCLWDPAQVEQIRLDARDAPAVAAALRGMDGVINCLSGSADAIRAGAQALFAAAAAQRPAPRVVHLSSMSVYGSALGDLTEEAALRGDLGPFSAAKVQAEECARGYPNCVILRPGCVYGPGSDAWSGRIARWLLAGRIGDLGAAGDGFCNLAHVDDVVEAAVQALEAPLRPPDMVFNLCIPEPPTWNEYLVKYGRALGAVPVKRIPEWQLRLEASVLAPPIRALQIASAKTHLRVLSPPPPIPRSFLRLARQEIRLVVTRAQRVLGWSSVPLDKGIAGAAQWFQAARAG